LPLLTDLLEHHRIEHLVRGLCRIGSASIHEELNIHAHFEKDADQRLSLYR
jgi:hypothetical protein